MYTPRTWQVIYAQIVTAKQAQADLSGLTSTSKAAYWSLWAFIVAVSQSFLEQIWSILQVEIETTVATGAPETVQWIQAKVLEFQYGNVIQINADFSLSYPLPALPLILDNCAVVSAGSGAIAIKVTSPSGLLSAPQLAALTSYLNTILGADVTFTIINVPTDILDIFGTVYYNGQFAGTIVTNVTNSVNAYIASIGFNGTIKLSNLIDKIRNVAGVTDFVPSDVYSTPNGGSAVYMVNASVIQSREYQTLSGQIIIDGSNPLSSSLTYSIDNN